MTNRDSRTLFDSSSQSCALKGYSVLPMNNFIIKLYFNITGKKIIIITFWNTLVSP